MINSSYPRPQLRRENFELLDGEWEFIFDEGNIGLKEGYYRGFNASQTIKVPFVYSTPLSGINQKKRVDVLWYQREITISKDDFLHDVMINFEGVDYRADVYLNGQFIGSHEGAYARFSLCLNQAMVVGVNKLVVRTFDSYNVAQPRGKQKWMNDNFGCWYKEASGIWKSVWLERINFTRIREIKVTPRVEQMNVEIEYVIDNFHPGLTLSSEISFEGIATNRVITSLAYPSGKIIIELASPYLSFQNEFWHPDRPKIYDIKLTLSEDQIVEDKVDSYFGFREYRAHQGQLLLNGFSFYSKLCLYQAYWPLSNMTLPDLESARKDILLLKELGFNGIRIHQTIIDERFLALCDELGLIVWCEMPSPHIFNLEANRNVLKEWMEILHQYYNHPSIFVWVLFNESWGIREISENRLEQSFVDALYLLTKAFDPYRPAISNDGWEHTKSDILTIHNYEQSADKLLSFYKDINLVMSGKTSSLSMRNLLADGYKYEGQPFIFSEFGGAALKKDTADGWGYGGATDGIEEFYTRYRQLIEVIYDLPYLSGFCYTQFSDVEQEKNGLVTIDRKVKVDISTIKKIMEKH